MHLVYSMDTLDTVGNLIPETKYLYKFVKIVFKFDHIFGISVSTHHHHIDI
jgi:hypothetical protein